jgi:hypothetical protein
MAPIFYIIKSILITAAISTIIALVFLSHFWQAFAISAALQVIIFYIINTIRDVSIQKLENQRIAEYSKQGLLLKCPCYKQNQEFVPIVLNENNNYNCEVCSKPVVVSIEATTLAATVPVDLENSQDKISQIYSKITNGN